MSVLHYLFWTQNNFITAFFYETGKMKILKLGGRKSVRFTDDYWKKWIGYAGMCKGDKIDFCLIYDERPVLDAQLSSEQCDSKDCIWSRTKIEEAAKLMEVKEPTEIRNENGMLLVKAGRFINVRKEDIITLTASYMKADKNTETDELLPGKTTAFIKYYRGELQAYKKGYEK